MSSATVGRPGGPNPDDLAGEYSQRRERILALWNTGDRSRSEIGVAFGISHATVAGVLCKARRGGLAVSTVTPAERGRRAARSLRARRDMAVITPEASLLLRAAWLSGVSAVRIAVMLDTPELLVRMEARRLGLPRRKHSHASTTGRC